MLKFEEKNLCILHGQVSVLLYLAQFDVNVTMSLNISEALMVDIQCTDLKEFRITSFLC